MSVVYVYVWYMPMHTFVCLETPEEDSSVLLYPTFLVPLRRGLLVNLELVFLQECWKLNVFMDVKYMLLS